MKNTYTDSGLKNTYSEKQYNSCAIGPDIWKQPYHHWGLVLQSIIDRAGVQDVDGTVEVTLLFSLRKNEQPLVPTASLDSYEATFHMMPLPITTDLPLNAP